MVKTTWLVTLGVLFAGTVSLSKLSIVPNGIFVNPTYLQIVAGAFVRSRCSVGLSYRIILFVSLVGSMLCFRRIILLCV